MEAVLLHLRYFPLPPSLKKLSHDGSDLHWDLTTDKSTVSSANSENGSHHLSVSVKYSAFTVVGEAGGVVEMIVDGKLDGAVGISVFTMNGETSGVVEMIVDGKLDGVVGVSAFTVVGEVSCVVEKIVDGALDGVVGVS